MAQAGARDAHNVEDIRENIHGLHLHPSFQRNAERSSKKSETWVH
jgi:hypothetical protein